MEAIAKLKHVRISPRKVKIVLDLIRGKSIKEAEAILKYTNKAACCSLDGLLHSAVANATNNLNMDGRYLFVSECYVTPASMLKRIRPMSKGRSSRILKRMSHVTLKVREKSKEGR